jgi:hypothetical protein
MGWPWRYRVLLPLTWLSVNANESTDEGVVKYMHWLSITVLVVKWSLDGCQCQSEQSQTRTLALHYCRCSRCQPCLLVLAAYKTVAITDAPRKQYQKLECSNSNLQSTLSMY